MSDQLKYPTHIMRFFSYDHLPDDLMKVSASIYKVADEMNEYLLPGAEKAAGLRKLLEAKDCFVRAQLEAIGRHMNHHEIARLRRRGRLLLSREGMRP